MDHDDLQRQCADLESLGRSRPNKHARQLVEAALASKWEGVQVCAARALAAWGDSASVALLRDWLHLCLSKNVGWGITGVAVSCLAQCCSMDDATWILDTYFEAADPLTRHELLPLLDSVKANILRERIAIESRAHDKARVDAAQAAARRLAHRTDMA